MSNIDPELLKKLEEYSSDKASFLELKTIISSFIADKETIKEQLQLLENAVKNDYNSILITELGLEKPGPKIIYVNDGFTEMTGYSREEAIGNTPRMLQGPKTDRAILERLKRRLIEGQAFFGHTINYRKDGTEFINQWDIHPLMNSEGEVTHWVSYQRDVTEKRETAKAIFNTDFDALLKRREEFTIKFVKDESGSISCKYVNEAFEEITGLDKSEIFDSGIQSVLHKDDVKGVENHLKEAFEGTESTEKCRYRNSENEYLVVLQSFKPIWNDASTKVKSVKSIAKLELKEV